MIDEILQKVVAKYKSLKAPDFSFVEKSINNNPYKGVFKELSLYYDILETTDVNTDVCFVLRITNKDSCSSWILELSMVNKYAVLFKNITSEENSYCIVEQNTINVQSEEVLHILAKSDIILLPYDVLVYKYPLPLFNTEIEDVNIYNCLFSDTKLSYNSC